MKLTRLHITCLLLSALLASLAVVGWFHGHTEPGVAAVAGIVYALKRAADDGGNDDT